MTDEPSFPNYPCCMPGGSEECVCGLAERALRHIAFAGLDMTTEQRDWCKQEVLAVEGYDERDVEVPDSQLASTVLRAWQDYCRDKGLL